MTVSNRINIQPFRRTAGAKLAHFEPVKTWPAEALAVRQRASTGPPALGEPRGPGLG